MNSMCRQHRDHEALIETVFKDTQIHGHELAAMLVAACRMLLWELGHSYTLREYACTPNSPS